MPKVDIKAIVKDLNKELSKKNKNNDRIKGMLVNVATKETCITINTIRNRYIELS